MVSCFSWSRFLILEGEPFWSERRSKRRSLKRKKRKFKVVRGESLSLSLSLLSFSSNIPHRDPLPDLSARVDPRRGDDVRGGAGLFVVVEF